MTEFITCIVCKTCVLALKEHEKREKEGCSIIYAVRAIKNTQPQEHNHCSYKPTCRKYRQNTLFIYMKRIPCLHSAGNLKDFLKFAGNSFFMDEIKN